MIRILLFLVTGLFAGGLVAVADPMQAVLVFMSYCLGGMLALVVQGGSKMTMKTPHA